jgi:hypothetical protein
MTGRLQGTALAAIDLSLIERLGQRCCAESRLALVELPATLAGRGMRVLVRSSLGFVVAKSGTALGAGGLRVVVRWTVKYA